MDATLVEKLPYIPMLVILVSVHEFAHAWVADKLGDDTPRNEGRVTLNPLAHIDWIGTVALPAFMILFSPGLALLGWGRPVQTQPANFGNPERDTALVALAGPVVNLLLAFFALLLLHIIPADFQKLAIMFAMTSIFLGLFNLLPIPQFDGWRIIQPLFRLSEEIAYWGGGWFWTLVLLLLINWGPFMRALSLVSQLILNLLGHAAGLN